VWTKILGSLHVEVALSWWVIGAALLIAIVGAGFVWRRGRGNTEAEAADVDVPQELGAALGLAPAQLLEQGQVWAHLLCEGASWILRRKETVTLLDPKSIRRRASVDFSVPPELGPIDAVGEAEVLVPLVLLEKRPAVFTRFDFADEDHSSLPLPTKRENANVSAAILIAAATHHLGPRPSDALVADLVSLAHCDGDDTERYLDRVLGRSRTLAEVDRVERCPLGNNGTFEWLAGALGSSSVVVVRVPANKRDRRHIVKLAFDQRMDELSTQRPWALGWAPFELFVDSPFVGAQSYHLEAEVPGSLEILDAVTITEMGDDEVMLVGASAMSPRVHVYVPSAESARNSIARVHYRVERGTFLLGAFVASLLITAVLGACVGFAERIAEHATSLASLLVIFPTVVVGFVLRGTGHDVANRFVWAARGILLFAGLLPFIAAGRLAIDGITDDFHPTAAGLRWWWIPLTGLSLFCTLALLAAVVLPRPSESELNLRDQFPVPEGEVEAEDAEGRP
jgi:hypothetical protein